MKKAFHTWTHYLKNYVAAHRRKEIFCCLCTWLGSSDISIGHIKSFLGRNWFMAVNKAHWKLICIFQISQNYMWNGGLVSHAHISRDKWVSFVSTTLVTHIDNEWNHWKKNYLFHSVAVSTPLLSLSTCQCKEITSTTVTAFRLKSSVVRVHQKKKKLRATETMQLE